MTCSACAMPSTGDLCEACAGKVVRVRAATRATVDRSARASMMIASRAEGERGEGLLEYLVSGRAAGREW